MSEHSQLEERDSVEAAERERVQAHDVSWAMRDVQRAHAAVDRELARRLGLRSTDYAAMDHLMTAEQPLGPADLSARLGISTGSATELVDRLVSQGHVEKRPHKRDRRRVVLTPTETTLREIITELGSVFDDLDHLADTFNAPEQVAIGRYLRSAAALLRAYATSTTRAT